MSEPAAPPLERILGRAEHGPRSIVDMALGHDPRRPPSVDLVGPPPTIKGSLTRRAHNRPVKVPRPDWVAVLSGSKRMYRTYADSWRARHARLFPVEEVFPRPVVIYSQIAANRRYDTALAVVTAYRQEQLREITAADVRAEGFERLGQFRRYWRQRYHRWGWRPDDLISVVQLRPWEEHDDEEQGAWLLRQLYGTWL